MLERQDKDAATIQATFSDTNNVGEGLPCSLPDGYILTEWLR